MKKLLNPTKPTLIASLILGVISLVSAFVIMVEKLHILENPNYVPSCSLNPLISCSPIMSSDQAAAFGFPNPLLGILGYGLVTLITFTALFVKLPRWYWLAYALGVTFAMGFLIWLMVQALFVIGALCIYCCVVWVSTISLFWLAWSNLARETKFESFNYFKPLFIVLSYLALILVVFLAFQDFWISLI